nr:MAG TPA: hypothetical protein [Caudoviricetes sp.]
MLLPSIAETNAETIILNGIQMTVTAVDYKLINND